MTFCSKTSSNIQSKFIVSTKKPCENCGSIMSNVNELDIRFQICPSCHSLEIKKSEIINISKYVSKSYNHTNFHTICDYTEDEATIHMKIPFFKLPLRSLPFKIYSELYRGYLSMHLVRIDKIDQSSIIVTSHGGSMSEKYDSIQISVYFSKNLNSSILVNTETIRDKVMKMLGFFNKEDIIIGDKELDPKFIFQGTNIKKLFQSNEIRNELKFWLNNMPILIYEKGILKIDDERIALIEGPYSEKRHKDSFQTLHWTCNTLNKLNRLPIEKNRITTILLKLIKFANLIESSPIFKSP